MNAQFWNGIIADHAASQLRVAPTLTNPEDVAMPVGCARSGYTGEKDRQFPSHVTERRGQRTDCAGVTAGETAPNPDQHRGWTLSRGRWPEPEWLALSPNYDASWEGEEDGWVSNGESASGRTREECIAEIDAWFDEHAA